MATFQQADWQLFGTYFNHHYLPKNVEAVQVDLQDSEKTENLIQTIRPDAIVHLAANSSTAFCEKNPEQTHIINVAVPAHLATLADENQIPFIFTSSEQVFDGTADIYTEQDIPAPQNKYGLQKMLAEQAVLQYDRACVVRIAVLFGKGTEHHRNFSQEWLNNWKDGKNITVFHDEFRSFLSGQNAAKGLYFLLNQEARGIYHLAGGNSMSRFEFAEMLREKANLPDAPIVKKSQKDVETPAFRPQNLILACEKIKAMGFQLSDIEQALDEIFE